MSHSFLVIYCWLLSRGRAIAWSSAHTSLTSICFACPHSQPAQRRARILCVPHVRDNKWNAQSEKDEKQFTQSKTIIWFCGTSSSTSSFCFYFVLCLRSLAVNLLFELIKVERKHSISVAALRLISLLASICDTISAFIVDISLDEWARPFHLIIIIFGGDTKRSANSAAPIWRTYAPHKVRPKYHFYWMLVSHFSNHIFSWQMRMAPGPVPPAEIQLN